MLANPTPDDLARVRSLADIIHSVDPFRAQVLREPDAVVERMRTPFFRHAAVYKVTYEVAPVLAMAFTIGHAEDWATVLLENNETGWMQLAESGVDLSSFQRRLAYSIVFLEATRSFDERFQLLFAPTELGSFEALTPEQHALLEQARARITEPAYGISETAPWMARFHAVRGFDLIRIHLRLHPRGEIERTDELLQKDVPLPLAL